MRRDADDLEEQKCSPKVLVRAGRSGEKGVGMPGAGRAMKTVNAGKTRHSRHFFSTCRVVGEEERPGRALTRGTRRLDRRHSDDLASLRFVVGPTTTNANANTKLGYSALRGFGNRGGERGAVSGHEARRRETTRGRVEARRYLLRGTRVNAERNDSTNTRGGSASTEFNDGRAPRVGGVSRARDEKRPSYVYTAAERGWKEKRVGARRIHNAWDSDEARGMSDRGLRRSHLLATSDR